MSKEVLKKETIEEGAPYFIPYSTFVRSTQVEIAAMVDKYGAVFLIMPNSLPLKITRAALQ